MGVSGLQLSFVDASLDRFHVVARPSGLLYGTPHRPGGPVLQVPLRLLAILGPDYTPLQSVGAGERVDALLGYGFAAFPPPLHLFFELVPDLLEGGLARPVEGLIEDGMHDPVSGNRREGGHEHEERREPDAHAKAGPELAPRLRREPLPGPSPEV